MKVIITHFSSELEVSIVYNIVLHNISFFTPLPSFFFFSCQKKLFWCKRIAFHVADDDVKGDWVKIGIDIVFEGRTGWYMARTCMPFINLWHIIHVSQQPEEETCINSFPSPHWTLWTSSDSFCFWDQFQEWLCRHKCRWVHIKLDSNNSSRISQNYLGIGNSHWS